MNFDPTLSETSPSIRGSGLFYILALVIIAGFAVAGVVTIVVLRPDSADNLIIITTLVTLLTPLLVGFMAKIMADTRTIANATSLAVSDVKTQAIEATKQAKETHDVVNSRMDEFKLQVSAIAKQEVASQLRTVRAEGRAEGIAEQQRLVAAQKVLDVAEREATEVRDRAAAAKLDATSKILTAAEETAAQLVVDAAKEKKEAPK